MVVNYNFKYKIIIYILFSNYNSNLYRCKRYQRREGGRKDKKGEKRIKKVKKDVDMRAEEW